MGKKIAISTIGTLGDVQPYLALAVALQAKGHSVVLGAPNDFRDMTESLGIEFYSLGSTIQGFLAASRFEAAMSDNMLVNGPALLQHGQKIILRAARRSWKMAQDSDAIIMMMNTSFGADIGEALNIPAIMSTLQPLNFTSEFPMCAYSGPDLGPAFNWISHTATTVQAAYYDFPRDALRQKVMGLPPRNFTANTLLGLFKNNDGEHLPTLCAYSKILSPKPKDWPDSISVTGFWPLADQTGWEPSAEFRAFLDNGSMPIYIGFGSMPFGAERNTQILREALQIWGGRAVVARGWGGIDSKDLPSSVYAIEKAPHDKLFKHVSAVVHHGGAGTTGAGLTAGKPTFVVPQAVDQPYWGRRVHELGCGPEPVRLHKLTPATLANKLRSLATNPSYQRNAKNVADQLNNEDGTGAAIARIEQVLADFNAGAAPRSRKDESWLSAFR